MAHNKKIYNPKFQLNFLHPKYWPTWCVVLLGILSAILPFKVRDFFAKILANIIMRVDSRANNRGKINLKLCFPDKTDIQREQILKDSYRTGFNVMLSFARISIINKKRLQQETIIKGQEYLDNIIKTKQNIILLVPHSWAIDFPAVLLASKGIPVTSIIKEQRNPILNWLIHRQRMQYGGRIFERNVGIKPFLKAIKEGFLGYYLPDEDHGPEQSVFAPFFATEKATLTVIGKLVKISKAKLVPVMAGYDIKTGKFIIEISQALEDFPTNNELDDASLVNSEITQMFTKYPEQYMWILNILRSKADGSKNY